MKEIKESQQASQGINIGNSGNQGRVMPEDAKGKPGKQNSRDDRHIPNQDRSSAKSSKQKEE